MIGTEVGNVFQICIFFHCKYPRYTYMYIYQSSIPVITIIETNCTHVQLYYTLYAWIQTYQLYLLTKRRRLPAIIKSKKNLFGTKTGAWTPLTDIMIFFRQIVMTVISTMIILYSSCWLTLTVAFCLFIFSPAFTSILRLSSLCFCYHCGHSLISIWLINLMLRLLNFLKVAIINHSTRV